MPYNMIDVVLDYEGYEIADRAVVNNKYSVLFFLLDYEDEAKEYCFLFQRSAAVGYRQ